MSWGDQRDIGGAGGPVAWSPNAFYKVGNLAISLVDFQCYCRRTAGSSPLDPSADATNWRAFGERPYKSIQRGVGSQTATSITISAVDMAKTEVKVLGAGKDSGGAFGGVIHGYLSSPTVVTVSGSASYSGGGGFSYEVVERW